MRTSTPSTRRSSSCSIRRCAASRSPSAAGWCSPPPMKRRPSACTAACRGGKARELCPELIFVGGHFKDYQRLGDAAIEVLGDFTPLVERISIDEAFADVAGLHASLRPAGGDRAKRSARACATSSGCRSRSAWRAPSTWRRSPRRWRSPTGCSSSIPRTELAFLHDLPVELMWGVGPATKARLAETGVAHHRAAGGTLRRARSQRLLGRAVGEKLAALAWNRDPREIRTHRRAHSAGAQSALGRKPADGARLPADAAPSRRPDRQPAPRQVAAPAGP